MKVRIVCQFLLPLCRETFTLFLLLLHLLLVTVSQYSVTVILGGLRSEGENKNWGWGGVEVVGGGPYCGCDDILEMKVPREGDYCFWRKLVPAPHCVG